MRDGRQILDALRGVFQDRVDDLEQVGGEQLDRVANRGFEQAARVAEKVQRHARSRKRRPRRRGCSKTRGRERPVRDPEARAHEQAMRRARRRANQRIGFITHFGSYLATLALLLVATRSLRIVMLVALGWGLGVFVHYLFAISAPKLRDRWVEKEVGTRAEAGVKTERQEVGTRSRRSLEDLSASIAHEIRNPITAAKSLVQQMGEDPASDENLEFADLALSELDRVERSISHLLRYARDEEPRFEPVDLAEIAQAAVAGLRDRAGAAGVDLSCGFDARAEIRGDVEKLRRVIENLVSNSIDAVQEEADASRAPQVCVLGGESLAGDEVWLRVLDNGPGIPPEEVDRVWSPFYTTKEDGTGLGLALSRKTVEAHGGRIEFRSNAPQGCEFVLTFPKDPEAISLAEEVRS